MSSEYKIALVGASSLLAKELKECLTESPLAASSFVLLDLEEAHGQLDQVGDEVTVRVRVRATDPKRATVQQVALVDVLPGGMEPVLNSPSDSDDADTPLWRRRLGGKSTWQIQYADIREDRVIFFGDVGKSLTEVTYKVKATNVGTFVVPSAYGEAMYERRIYARSAAAAFKIKPVSK